MARWTETSSGCWEWNGAPNSEGYGLIKVNGRNRGAHRWSYEQHVGPIPNGLSILHSCDNRMCVNPAHLRPGTQRENVADAVGRGRAARGQRVAGARLTDEQYAAIPRRLAAGERQIDIARDYGVSKFLIHQYVRHGALARTTDA